MGLFDMFKRTKSKVSEGNELKKDLNTNSGMWALWDYETYKNVDDYEKWEPLFCEDEDIETQIENKAFVPINIFEDGCRSFVLKIDEELNEREKTYMCVKSEEYLFYSKGKAILSGIDAVNTELADEDAIIIDLPEGYYSVSVFLLAWDEEPGAYCKNGEISPNALSDFVVVLKSNAEEKGVYRKKINTFSEDD